MRRPGGVFGGSDKKFVDKTWCRYLPNYTSSFPSPVRSSYPKMRKDVNIKPSKARMGLKWRLN